MPHRLTFLLLWLALGASAQSEIFTAPGLTAFTYSGPSTSRMEIVAVDGQDFSQAIRLRTPGGLPTDASRGYSIRIRGLVTTALKKNDWVVVRFAVHALERTGATAFVTLNYERSNSPYTKSINATLPVGDDWQRYAIPFQIAEDYLERQSYLDFWVGFDPQVIEIGAISALNYGPSFTPAGLETGYSYQGREPDAPWRAEAAARIEAIRKSDLKLQVLNADGTPAAGATVQVRQQRHAFGFGTAVAASGLLGTGSDNEKYRATFLRLYNKAVLENDLKWPDFESNRSRALAALAWLHGNGIQQIRGHNMVWPNWQWLPKDLPSLAGNPEALRARIAQHIADVGGATVGQVVDWDVLNEPIPNRDLQKILGDAAMVEWFQLARQADGQVRLFVNEYDIVAAGGANTVKQDQYFNLIQWFNDNKAPLDGAGMQGHFNGYSLTGMDRAKAILDRFATLGLVLQITEFDIDTYDEKLQADYTRDFLTLCFSHPAMDSFLMWGFWEGRHWIPKAALYRKDWTAKPNALVWEDLLYKQWWTNADLTTGDDGAAGLRGFLGDYQITVTQGDLTVTQTITLAKDSSLFTLNLPEAKTLN